MSGPVVEFKGASLGYGTRVILSGVELAVPEGAFVGILGPNGAGKTTMLKTLLGLIPTIKGRFQSHGTRFGTPRCGYVPQKERLDPIYPLSACDVAAMGIYRKLELLKRLRRVDESAVVRRALRDAGAEQLADKPFSALSGGQKQRVLIARALAAEPELLILDEPLAGIDMATQGALMKLLREIKEAHKLTVLMVSHRLEAERELFTHIAWVDEGRVDFGPAAEMTRKRKISEVFGPGS